VEHPIDYPAVIRDLEAKRGQMNSRFDAAIAAIKQVIALEARAGQLPLLDQSKVTTAGSAAAPYAGMLMLNAAVTHLKSVGRPVPNITLAKELEKGGFRHKSKNFANTLNSVLWRRAKDRHDLQKSEHGWELVAGAEAK
jgi:hypothetical protein